MITCPSFSDLTSCLAWGSVYANFAHFLPFWLLATAVAGVAVWLGLRRFEPEPAGPAGGWGGRGGRFLLAPLRLRTDWPGMALGCVVLLVLTDYQAFTQGFFRWDDFSFTQSARETSSLPALMRLYHNDHSLPLFRLWVSALLAAGGPGATAGELARCFNAVNFLTCLGVLLGGAILLARLQVRRLTVAGFCLFAWFWPGWGEFTTGFYTLIVYPQTFVAGVAAIICLREYLQSARPAWLAASVLGASVSAGLDISGIWVFFALGGFAWLAGGWQNPAVRRALPWLLLAFGLAAYYHLVWFHHPFSARELVQNPGRHIVSHGLAANLTTHWASLPLSVASGLGATLLSPVIPGFVGLLAERFYGRMDKCLPIYATELLLLVAAAWLAWRLARRLTGEDRRALVALALPVPILIGMTSVARISHLDLPGSLWPTKYFCVPQVWLMLAAAFLFDRALLADPGSIRRATRGLLAAAFAGAWLCGSFWWLERTLDIDSSRRPAGRQGNVDAAVRRRAAFASLQRDLEELARQTGRKQLDLPPLLGLYWQYPHLEFGYDPERGGTYLFPDLLSVAPATGLTLRHRAREDIDPAILAAIAAIPTLKPVFEPGPPAP